MSFFYLHNWNSVLKCLKSIEVQLYNRRNPADRDSLLMCHETMILVCVFVFQIVWYGVNVNEALCMIVWETVQTLKGDDIMC